MTDLTPTGNDNLINEFMGLPIGTMFHQDVWEWYMLIIDKIESLQYRVTISTTFVRIHTPGENIELNCTAFDGKQNATYCAIIEFIKWYNKNETN